MKKDKLNFLEAAAAYNCKIQKAIKAARET